MKTNKYIFLRVLNYKQVEGRNQVSLLCKDNIINVQSTISLEINVFEWLGEHVKKDSFYDIGLVLRRRNRQPVWMFSQLMLKENKWYDLHYSSRQIHTVTILELTQEVLEEYFEYLI